MHLPIVILIGIQTILKQFSASESCNGTYNYLVAKQKINSTVNSTSDPCKAVNQVLNKCGIIIDANNDACNRYTLCINMEYTFSGASPFYLVSWPKQPNNETLFQRIIQDRHRPFHFHVDCIGPYRAGCFISWTTADDKRHQLWFRFAPYFNCAPNMVYSSSSQNEDVKDERNNYCDASSVDMEFQKDPDRLNFKVVEDDHILSYQEKTESNKDYQNKNRIKRHDEYYFCRVEDFKKCKINIADSIRKKGQVNRLSEGDLKNEKMVVNIIKSECLSWIAEENVKEVMKKVHPKYAHIVLSVMIVILSSIIAILTLKPWLWLRKWRNFQNRNIPLPQGYQRHDLTPELEIINSGLRSG